MGRVENLLVKVVGIKYFMTFMIINIDEYNLLMGLDFLMKIRAIVDVERGLIQIKNIPGLDVQVLPLNIIDVLSSMSGDEFGITIMPISIMCEESENGSEEKMDVGSDDWEGCDPYGLLSLHESVRIKKWQQLEQEARTRHQLWVMQHFSLKESSIH